MEQPAADPVPEEVIAFQKYLNTLDFPERANVLTVLMRYHIELECRNELRWFHQRIIESRNRRGSDAPLARDEIMRIMPSREEIRNDRLRAADLTKLDKLITDITKITNSMQEPPKPEKPPQKKSKKNIE